MGRELQRRARFEHTGVVGAPHKVASESRERTFDTDMSDPRQMREALERMAEELCESLARRGRSGRTIGIKVRLDDFTTVTRAHTLPEPTCDPELVSAEALALLARYAPPRPVRLLGVRVAGLNAKRGVAPSESGEHAGEQEQQLDLPV
jgi:DNA polymerase-4